jgi:hypothetical protein
VLLDFAAPGQLRLLEGREHGRTIPLVDTALKVETALARQKSLRLLADFATA